jgi:glucose-1-phosphatase
MLPVKNIIFDLGNVLIDLDIDRTWQSMRHYFDDDLNEKLKALYPDGDLWIDFEVGKISETTFFETLRQASDAPLSIRQLKEAWNAMLLTINPLRFDMLARLKENYNLYILSNTNTTHLDFVDGYLRTTYGFDISEFESRYFVKPYYSHIINLRKPNVSIYEFVVKDAQLTPAETLFIDDMPANTEGAKKVGLQTLTHVVGAEIVEVLKEF